jgi:hypothetical protein
VAAHIEIPSSQTDRSQLALCTISSLQQAVTLTSDGLLEEYPLADVIDLHRQTLSLQHRGHPDRARSCMNLSVLLRTLFEQTGEESLLVESIDLGREAQFLRPHGHLDRAESCNNLSCSLITRFGQTGDESLLDEAINLDREALSLQLPSHPDRAKSCSHLAKSLEIRFLHTGKRPLLAEAIHLKREAYLLRPPEHPDRFILCIDLAFSLHAHFPLTGSGDESVLAEAINLNKEAISTLPQHPSGRWKPFMNLARIYLDRRFSQHSPMSAINNMQQAVFLASNDWLDLVSNLSELIAVMDLVTLPQDPLRQLLRCIATAINLASHAGGFKLDSRSQLRFLNTIQHLGPRAYWCAITCGQPEIGLELTERSRAIIWTQSLQMRGPQLSGIPSELESELELLFSRMSTSQVIRTAISLILDISTTSGRLLSMDDIGQYGNCDRIHQLIQQIGAVPGSKGFVRGHTYAELAQCASRSIVVMLVATEGECHALILQRDKKPFTLKLFDLSPEELMKMPIIHAKSQQDVHNYRMGMKQPTSMTSVSQVLKILWIKVVKPVLDCLGLQVRVTLNLMYETQIRTENFGIIAASPPLVPVRGLHVSAIACCRYI